jgi:hypothetical protein
MAIALVQSTKKVVTGVNNTTLAYGSNVTAGNLLCNAQSQFQAGAATITTPTDTLAHTYAGMVAEQSLVAGTIKLRSFYVENASGGADTVTFDMSGASTGDITVVVAEFSGALTAAALDQTSSATDSSGSSTAVNSGATAAIAQADEMVWGAMLHDSGSNLTITQGGGASLVQENEGGAANMPIATSYLIVAAIATYSATWTISSGAQWAAHVATFKAAGGGGGTNMPITLTGPGGGFAGQSRGWAA